MDSIEKIFKASQVFRSYPFCHSNPDRSFCYHGRYFGLCARCTTMYVGGIITIAITPLWIDTLTVFQTLYVGLSLMIPAGVDGTTQMFGNRESNNYVRAVTGLLLGIGIVLLTHGMVFGAVQYIL